MFGLVTMAAVHYLSSSSLLMRPSAEVEEVEATRRWERGERRDRRSSAAHLLHTPTLKGSHLSAGVEKEAA